MRVMFRRLRCPIRITTPDIQVEHRSVEVAISCNSLDFNSEPRQPFAKVGTQIHFGCRR